MKNALLSLIVPCYNEEETLASCVDRILGLRDQDVSLEIVIVDDCSTDGSLTVANGLAARHDCVTVLRHERNRGKGAAIRTGLMGASGDYIGIQDADLEYNPLDYKAMLEPLLTGKADVVYGSRYLRPDTRRVLYFWHTWMNKTLTFVSNMFTNLDISDMETCYKLFERTFIQKIAPLLREDRFGFEPEVTAHVAQSRARVYECAISYTPRSYEEGKKIGWKDGLRALYCILHYSAHTAPLPMQLILYFFIGFVSFVVNLASFSIAGAYGLPTTVAIVGAFFLSALVNYLLCITILFRHKARWSKHSESLIYFGGVAVMGGVDYLMTVGLLAVGMPPLWAKGIAAGAGFVFNFLLRRQLVFPEKRLTMGK